MESLDGIRYEAEKLQTLKKKLILCNHKRHCNFNRNPRTIRTRSKLVTFILQYSYRFPFPGLQLHCIVYNVAWYEINSGNEEQRHQRFGITKRGGWGEEGVKDGGERRKKGKERGREG